MQFFGLFSCIVLILAVGIINAVPYPDREVRSPTPAASDFPSLIRKARETEEPKKEDLEKSETAVIAYPYLGWPYAHYVPHVVYLGK